MRCLSPGLYIMEVKSKCKKVSTVACVAIEKHKLFRRAITSSLPTFALGARRSVKKHFGG